MLSKRSLTLACLLAGAAVISAVLIRAPFTSAAGNSYVVTNLLSNNGVPGTKTDGHLVNPWGNTFFPPGGPFWVNEQGTGLSQIIDGKGTQGPTFIIPKAPGATAPVGPTGIVANFNGNIFVFDTLDGTISAWNGGPSAAIVVNNHTSARYTGLAMGMIGASPFLYAANSAKTPGIDVFDGNFKPHPTHGGFVDPHPTGLKPYGIANIDGNIYVAYAALGVAAGAVNEFTSDGVFIRRFATGGTLNQPWAIVLAPANFGVFSNALLIGNFGSSTISAFNFKTQTFLGQLEDTKGHVIQIGGPMGGLWSLVFGEGAMGVTHPNALYFTAGPNSQRDGLFGYILPASGPTPTSTKKPPTPTPTKKRPTATATKKRPTATATKKRPTPTPTKAKVPTPTPTFHYPY